MKLLRAQAMDGRVFRAANGGYHRTSPQSGRHGLPAADRLPRTGGVPNPPAAPALARILRPQAAYRWLLPNLAAITPQYIELVLRGALAGDHVRQWELFDLMFDTWPELATCSQELTGAVSRLKLIFEPYTEEGAEPSEEARQRCQLVSAALRRMAPDATADENDLEGTIQDILDGWFRGVTCLEIDWQTITSPLHGRMVAPRATFWVHPICFAWDQTGRLGLRVDAQGQVQPGHAGGLAIHAQPAAVAPFPPSKFLVGIHKAKSGSALGGALLRPLAWWWCAANFSADWLLNLAQVFGLPFRWANYASNAPQETIDAVCSMLQNMGSAGWAAFPAGTTLELKDTGTSGDRSPQGDLLDRADRYARMVILGQTLSGSQDASKGGGKAFGSVEADVKGQRIDAAGRYACRVLNTQLIPAILALNYGDTNEAPSVRLLEEEEGGLAQAQRDEILSRIMPLSEGFLRKKYGQPQPADEDDAVGGPPPDPESSERVTRSEPREEGASSFAQASAEDDPHASQLQSRDYPGNPFRGNQFRDANHSPKEPDQSKLTPADELKNPIEPERVPSPLESAALDTVGHAQPDPGHDAPVAERRRVLAEEQARLRAWAEENGKLKGRLPQRESGGGEHIVATDHARQRVIKATRTEVQLGYGLAYGSYIAGATPGEYLDRLALHNRIFQDDVQLERIVPVADKLSIVTSQPFIEGPEAPQPAIDAFMAGKGFEQLPGRDGRYYHSGEGVLVWDLLPKNARTNAQGEVVPIDPVIQRVTPDFADFLRHNPLAGKAAELQALLGLESTALLARELPRLAALL